MGNRTEKGVWGKVRGLPRVGMSSAKRGDVRFPMGAQRKAGDFLDKKAPSRIAWSKMELHTQLSGTRGVQPLTTQARERGPLLSQLPMPAALI